MTSNSPVRSAVPEEHEVIIVGGGQAGLSMSYCLKERAIDHLVLEKQELLHTWKTERWDSFCLVTPNWQCQLPGHPYRGDDPHGFMVKHEIIAYLDAFVEMLAPPAKLGVAVTHVGASREGGFLVETSAGSYAAREVVVASGGYHTPIVPRFAERLSPQIHQLHSARYKSPASLPDGPVLVVGSGQSGAQIAEDLHLAGRKVFLAVGNAPRCARFHRGKDVVDWLSEMGYYDLPVDQHPLREGVRDNTNHYVTGRDGGRDIDLRRFAKEGMELLGALTGLEGDVLTFAENLKQNLDQADQVYNRINASIDQYILEHGIDAPAGQTYRPVWEPPAERTKLDLKAAGVSTIVWCIGFKPDFDWLDLPVFNGRGLPRHSRGVTPVPGLYFLGLPWLYTWGSGRFSGVARDAAFLAENIAARRGQAGRHAPLTTEAALATSA
ncbi:MAG: MSMEG_0569 family flavin-dependent oxidoreductase [Burkholderiaceae bacterium]|jgi:putative flavoprotein involved in K+ transport